VNHEAFIESIHRELDGMNSEEESRELQRRLESDPEALTLYREFEAVGRALSTLEEVEPPRALRHDILQAVATLGPDIARGGRGPVLRYGWALAAGIVLGMFAGQLLPQGASDIDGLSGTMAPPSIPDASRSLQPTAEWRIDAQGVVGIVELKQNASRIEVAVELNSSDPVFLVLSHDETVGVIGLSQDGTAVEIRESGSGHVVLGASGEHRYRLALSRTAVGSTTLDLGLFRDDELIDEYEVNVGDPK
jgi:hypothetical protein